MDLSGDLLARLVSPQSLWIALWVGLAVFTVVLIGLLHTRLGASKPLQKCTILAVWFHLLLLIYATSIQVVAERPGGGNQVTINLSSGGAAAPPPKSSPIDLPLKRKELPASLTSSGAKLLAPTLPAPRLVKDSAPAKPQAMAPAAVSVPKPVAAVAQLAIPKPSALPKVETVAKASAVPNTVPNTTPKTADTVPRVAKLDVPKPIAPAPLNTPAPKSVTVPKPAMVPIPQTSEAAAPMVPVRPPVEVAALSPAATTPAAALDTAAKLSPMPPTAVPETLRRPAELEYHTPQLYQQRLAADKNKLAAAHGGSAKTEAAVNSALKWLSTHQEPDGRWNPRRFGAGQESEALGHNRGGAGAKADAGISALALLAFLGAGHTHQRGDYQPTVAAAIQFIVDSQHPNGNLGGEAEPFAFMYCHGMACLALSESLAMTGDERLKDPVRRAIGYTISCQNRTTGGWRYRPHESGDLSQLGWQLMALKSAELGGIETPQETRDGMIRFLQGVSSGKHGGLASYRAGERVSCPMTAEGLLCKQFLGLPRQNPASDEAGDHLLGELPGSGPSNYYYWYYGTLSMYQLQGSHWQKWNDALTTQLLRTQVDRGDDSGTWAPDDLWGSYGGRVYSTALATLCLEVYYRYLPLYVEAAANGGETLRK